MNTFGMEQGKRYRIVYRRFGGRVNDECVAEYLGESASHELLVSFRPVAGTTAFLPRQIVAVDQTDDPCRLGRRSPNQDAPLDEAKR